MLIVESKVESGIKKCDGLSELHIKTFKRLLADDILIDSPIRVEINKSAVNKCLILNR